MEEYEPEGVTESEWADYLGRYVRVFTQNGRRWTGVLDGLEYIEETLDGDEGVITQQEQPRLVLKDGSSTERDIVRADTVETFCVYDEERSREKRIEYGLEEEPEKEDEEDGSFGFW